MTPEEYGASEGWRLLTTDEVHCYPDSLVEYSGRSYAGVMWHPDCVPPGKGTTCLNLCYRTQAPLPPHPDDDPLTQLAHLVGTS